MEFDLSDLEGDPTMTPEMKDFFIACEQAKADIRRGAFVPTDANVERPHWDVWPDDGEETATF